MNLNSFLYVAEIERCGSIAGAAQNLYTSQSNLSTALKSLEEELGCRCLNVLVTAAFPLRKATFYPVCKGNSCRNRKK